MEENIKVVIQVELKLPVNTIGLTDKQVFDAVETIRNSVHKQISNAKLMGMFQVDTNAFIEDV